MDNKIEIYKIADQETRIVVRFGQDTVLLAQQQMASLFEQTKQNISLHINNCFKEEELYPDSVVKESLTTATDGKRYRTKYYNLGVIISVGYRVKSKRGVQFRQWATNRLKGYLVDGYAINQKRLEEQYLELQHLKTGIAILRRAIAHQALLKRYPGRLPVQNSITGAKSRPINPDQTDAQILRAHHPGHPPYQEHLCVIREKLQPGKMKKDLDLSP